MVSRQCFYKWKVTLPPKVCICLTMKYKIYLYHTNVIIHIKCCIFCITSNHIEYKNYKILYKMILFMEFSTFRKLRSWHSVPSVSQSVQLISRVWLFATPWIAARQTSLYITNSQSLLKLMSMELVMPSSHLILCHPLLLLPPIPPSIRVFSNESTLCMRWPKYWSFSFNISPSNEHPGLISFRMV